MGNDVHVRAKYNHSSHWFNWGNDLDLNFVVTVPSRYNLDLTAAASFAYAALFITEGIGLWLEKRWAEYLTIFATSSFIPFETWEVIKKTTAFRLAILIANVAIVIYLVQRRWRVRNDFCNLLHPKLGRN